MNSDWRSAVLVLATGITVVGCGGDGPPTAFEDRSNVPSCGEVTVTPYPETGAAPHEFDCLRTAAASGDSAELEITSGTVEGDPITTWLRVLDAERTEIFIDNSEDEFRGEAAWVRYECPSLTFDDAGYAEVDLSKCNATDLT